MSQAAPAGSAPILATEGLTKRFGGLTAVDGVKLAVHPGLALGVIGPNGAGKSTLINLVTGQYRPTAGRVLVNGQDMTGRQPYQLVRSGVARTFQNLKLFDNLTVLENVVAGMHHRLRQGFIRSVFPDRHELNQALDEAAALLARVGLGGKEREISASLAYGDRKRLEIARALATGPQMLLLDEPAAGMNPVEAGQLVELLGQLHGEGLTLLLVEHNMAVVMAVCKRIVVLNHGRKLAEGSPAEVQTNADVIQAYLGGADGDDHAKD